jgi:hypothetical protein
LRLDHSDGVGWVLTKKPKTGEPVCHDIAVDYLANGMSQNQSISDSPSVLLTERTNLISSFSDTTKIEERIKTLKRQATELRGKGQTDSADDVLRQNHVLTQQQQQQQIVDRPLDKRDAVEQANKEANEELGPSSVVPSSEMNSSSIESEDLEELLYASSSSIVVD